MSTVIAVNVAGEPQKRTKISFEHPLSKSEVAEILGVLAKNYGSDQAIATVSIDDGTSHSTKYYGLNGASR